MNTRGITPMKRWVRHVIPKVRYSEHTNFLYCIRHYFRVQLFSRFWPGAVIREWLISRFLLMLSLL